MKLDKLTGRGCEYLFRHPTHKTIYFRRFTTKTGEVTQSLRTQDLIEAKSKRDVILRGSRAPVRQKKTALELLDAWIERKEALGRSPATITSIKNSRNSFELYLAVMMPEDITASWWESDYIPTVKASTWKDRKFFNDCKWLKSFLKQLHDDGVIHKLPKLLNPDPRVSVGKVFTDEEVGTLLNFAQNADLHLAILMAATMGMRRGEIFGLSSSRVDLEAGMIELRREDVKTRKARAFSIAPAVLPYLKERVQSGAPWIFPSKADPNKALHKDGYMTAWKNLKLTCDITGRFHDLRHTFLTKAFAAPGANPALICHYAGLSLEVAERTYLHLTKEDSKKVAALVSYDA